MQGADFMWYLKAMMLAYCILELLLGGVK